MDPEGKRVTERDDVTCFGRIRSYKAGHPKGATESHKLDNSILP